MPIFHQDAFNLERSKSCPLTEELSIQKGSSNPFMFYPSLAKSESMDNILLFSHDPKSGNWKCNLVKSPNNDNNSPLKSQKDKEKNKNLAFNLDSFDDVDLYPSKYSTETLSSSTVSKFFPRFANSSENILCELLFSTETVDIGILLFHYHLERLRKICWKGIPFSYRSICWKYLFGYLPPVKSKQQAAIERRRREYYQSAKSLGVYPEVRPSFDMALFHQIEIDIPRTIPSVALFRHPSIQPVLLRILYCWSIRHPSSGYVQGLNDLLAPFIAIFLSEYLCAFPIFRNSKRMNNNVLDYLLHLPEQYMQHISTEELEAIEADAFWCFSKFLDMLHDRYTSGQPGIWTQLAKLEDLMFRIDPPLITHLKEQGVEINIFAFRWINCLLIRELPFRLVIRLWDTCFSEGEEGFLNFYTYVMASFFMTWSNRVKRLNFQDILLLLQNLPTGSWTDEQISVLCSEAFILMELFSKSKGHLKRLV